MTLRIETFRNDIGGNAIYKALSHPLAAEPGRALLAKLTASASIAIYDPHGIVEAFDAFYPLGNVALSGYFVQSALDVGKGFRGLAAQPVTELSTSPARAVFIATFDAQKALGQIDHLLLPHTEFFSFESLKLPAELQTDKMRYLNALNFATNFAFFRDEDGQHTRLVTANYWPRYGAKEVRLWCRLFGQDGAPLATWMEDCGEPEASIVIDSREVRARFDLPAFTGQLFIHAVGVAGHDTVKYALDTFGDDPEVLSATHDANSWPSNLYAGLPAPDLDEEVILWVQNSHPVPIAEGEIGLARMGQKHSVRFPEGVAPFATRAICVSQMLPELHWPDQIEIDAGKHFVRPRYEVVAKSGRSRIAHPNVERGDLTYDPQLANLRTLLGKGHILPAAILPLENYATTALPTPMATEQLHLPVMALIYDASGTLAAEHRFGRLARDHASALDVSDLSQVRLKSGYGHLELVYDFDAGTDADGWLHALFRYRNRKSGHQAETSFGSHIFNTALTYRGEPQSYSGPPPGLSTRLFLRVAPQPLETFCHLIYPVSQSWRAHSHTTLTLRATNGQELAHQKVEIPASGSLFWRVREVFDGEAIAAAGSHPYVIVRDETCRLFGYHGVENTEGSFSLDHMFGF